MEEKLRKKRKNEMDGRKGGRDGWSKKKRKNGWMEGWIEEEKIMDGWEKRKMDRQMMDDEKWK